MEVATMYPYRGQHDYTPHYVQQYAQYHDVRARQPFTATTQSNQTRPAEDDRIARQNVSSHAQSVVPIVADDKPSLPSISNLLGIADGERTLQAETPSRTSIEPSCLRCVTNIM